MIEQTGFESLSKEELEDYTKKTGILYGFFITSELPVKVSWDSIHNVLGLKHLYIETFDKMKEFLKRDRNLDLCYNDEVIFDR